MPSPKEPAWRSFRTCMWRTSSTPQSARQSRCIWNFAHSRSTSRLTISPRRFRTIAQGGAQMALILLSPFFAEHRAQLAELAIQHRLPSMFIFKSYVEVGGLMAYGVDQAAMYRRTAAYV